MLTVTCALVAFVLHFPGLSSPTNQPRQPPRPVRAGLSTGPGEWRWPLAPAPRVLRAYHPPPAPWLPGHRGVDLAARPGQPVYAAGAGRVSYAGRLAGRGVVTLVHGPLRTTYLPVRPSVRLGQRLAAGDRLGVVEDVRGHCGPRLCLHWGLLRGLVYLDPLSLLGRGPVRLLPVWGSSGAAPFPPGASGPANDPDARHAVGMPAAGRSPAADTRGVPTGQAPSMTLAAATTAGGGAVAGATLAYGLSMAWHRRPARTRLPPDVINFARERERRRSRPRRGGAPDDRPA
jgi:hypothetical protein